MTGERRVNLTVTAAACVLAMLAGVAGTYLMMRDTAADTMRDGSSTGTMNPASSSPGAAPPSTPAAPSAATRDVVVALAPEAAARAGIVTSQITSAAMTDRLRLPGVVYPNAYRQVAVTPLVAGRVVRATVQLGDRVHRGQAIAAVYSPELAEARTKYLTASAMLDAHDRELQRTQRLVEIGAASRQELERLHAEHQAQTAEVESARSRLELLGATDDGPTGQAGGAATVTVQAPIDGVITERLANVGLNVGPDTALFSVVDLSTVWIVADVYEKDLHSVREGAVATVTTSAYPDRSIEGRVSYIDPQLDAVTRTAKVRVEVPNPRGELRLGMYADVTIASADATRALSVPRDAVQQVGGRQVVYVAVRGEPAKFAEREVTLGRSSAGAAEVVTGIRDGDAVVTKGSFFLRAEAERLGLRPAPVSGPGDSQSREAEVQTAKITVTEKGFEPAKIALRRGVLAKVTVMRTTDKTCATEIVFPPQNAKRPLPLNTPFVIEFTPEKSGELTFACGMGMLKGTIVVQ